MRIGRKACRLCPIGSGAVISTPLPFRIYLARYFLQIPAIFEHQLQFSTTLIFDEPSFRNGIQVSGFIDRPIRELVISFIGHAAGPGTR